MTCRAESHAVLSCTHRVALACSAELHPWPRVGSTGWAASPMMTNRGPTMLLTRPEAPMSALGESCLQVW